jgi:hypothetical protein
MPFITRLPPLTGADPYPDALLALDFVGARRGPQYYKSGGVTVSDITQIPGWTYTGGTPAGTGSYAPKADGSLQFFPSVTNLLLQSQTFDNASWIKSAASVTADQVLAPDGTMTADMVTENTATSAHAIYGTSSSIVSGSTYAASIYIKGGTRRYVSLRTDYVSASNWPWVTLDTQTGTLTANAYATGYSVSAAANGFWRVSVPWVSGATIGANIVIAGSDVSTPPASATLGNSYTGTSATFYIWGAQLELGSTASTYIPTTTAAVTVAPPRITDAGYLAEESRTNSIPQNGTAGAVVGVYGSGGAVPNGWTPGPVTGISYEVVSIGSGAYGPYIDVRIYGTNSSGATAYPGMYFSGGTTIVAATGQTWASSVYTALVAGSLSGVTTPLLNVVENTAAGAYVANGTSNFTLTSDTTRPTLVRTLSGGATTARTYLAFMAQTANGASINFTVRLSLPQQEQGSFATSPIPTTSVAVTRAADVGYISGLTVPSAYSVMAQATTSPQTTGFPQVFSLDSGATSDDAQFYFNAAAPQKLFGFVRASSATQAFLDLGAASNSTLYSAAMRVAANDFAATKSGASPTTDATGTVPTTAILRMGIGPFSNNWNGPIRRIVIYPRAMSNAELQAITTAGAY